MSKNTEILIVIWAFWIAIIVLDLIALFRVRRLALGPLATVLWAIWIIVAPVVGAISSFIVATSDDNTAAMDRYEVFELQEENARLREDVELLKKERDANSTAIKGGAS